VVIGDECVRAQPPYTVRSSAGAAAFASTGWSAKLGIGGLRRPPPALPLLPFTQRQEQKTSTATTGTPRPRPTAKPTSMRRLASSMGGGGLGLGGGGGLGGGAQNGHCVACPATAAGSTTVVAGAAPNTMVPASCVKPADTSAVCSESLKIAAERPEATVDGVVVWMLNETLTLLVVL